MTFQSILFEKPEDRVTNDTPEAPVFFVDLNLDQIIEAITASRAEYNLKPFFIGPWAISKDCLKNAAIVRDIYDIAVGAIEAEKKAYWNLFNYPDAILRRSIELLQMSVTKLKKLRNVAAEHANRFESEGFTALFAMLKKESGDEYFAKVQNHLGQLKFRGGVLVSAE